MGYRRGAGCEPLLGRQLHELHPLLPNAGLQPRFQGYLQEHVPEVQSENGVRFVLRRELGFWWHVGGLQFDHRVPLGLRTYSFGFGRGFRQEEFLWPWRLHREDHQGPPGFLRLVRWLRRVRGWHRRLSWLA